MIFCDLATPIKQHLQTGSDFRKLVSTSPDCKFKKNLGKSHVVYSNLKDLKNLQSSRCYTQSEIVKVWLI